MPAKALKAFYYALGFEQDTGIVIIGVSDTKEGADKHFQRLPNAVAYHSINMMAPTADIIANELFTWLNHECGLVPLECKALIQKFGKAVQEMMDDIADSKGWRKRKKRRR